MAKKHFSSEDQRRDFFKHFQEYKVFKQKAFYFDEGATMYYASADRHKHAEDDAARVNVFLKEYNDFLLGHVSPRTQKDQRIALVSLGCGNAMPEKLILEGMRAAGYQVELFAIDSSPDMVALAQETLADSDGPVHYYCADFSSEEFIEEFTKKVKLFDRRIYLFLGGTLGNVEQDYIADILYDMLQTKDIMLLDVGVRQELSDKGDRLVFERCLKYLDIEEERNFFLKPLRDIGVSQEKGELFLVMRKEVALNALRFVFSFRFFEKTVVHYHDRTMTFLPDTIVSLITIRVYDPEGLRHFFEERNFSFLAQLIRGNEGLFLFEKNNE